MNAYILARDGLKPEEGLSTKDYGAPPPFNPNKIFVPRPHI